jgi:hypothetical protein
MRTVGEMLVVLALTGTGALAAADEAVEAGRRALTARTTYPWYDAEQDALRRLDVKTTAPTAAHRNSTWEARPRPAPDLSVWQQFLRLVWKFVTWAFWIGIAVLLAVLTALLVRSFLTRESGADEATADSETFESRTEEELLEHLPFTVRRPTADLLGEARRHYEAGRYGEAVIYLFSYQLVQLDKHQLLRLTRGKTNRQYLSELWERADVRAILERTMVAFEDVFFGHHDLDRARFETCWTRLDEFHQRIEEATAT